MIAKHFAKILTPILCANTIFLPMSLSSCKETVYDGDNLIIHDEDKMQSAYYSASYIFNWVGDLPEGNTFESVELHLNKQYDVSLVASVPTIAEDKTAKVDVNFDSEIPIYDQNFGFSLTFVWKSGKKKYKQTIKDFLFAFTTTIIPPTETECDAETILYESQPRVFISFGDFYFKNQTSDPTLLTAQVEQITGEDQFGKIITNIAFDSLNSFYLDCDVENDFINAGTYGFKIQINYGDEIVFSSSSFSVVVEPYIIQPSSKIATISQNPDDFSKATLQISNIVCIHSIPSSKSSEFELQIEDCTFPCEVESWAFENDPQIPKSWILKINFINTEKLLTDPKTIKFCVIWHKGEEEAEIMETATYTAYPHVIIDFYGYDRPDAQQTITSIRTTFVKFKNIRWLNFDNAEANMPPQHFALNIPKEYSSFNIQPDWTNAKITMNMLGDIEIQLSFSYAPAQVTQDTVPLSISVFDINEDHQQIYETKSNDINFDLYLYKIK